MAPISVLSLAPITPDGEVASAFRNLVALAQAAEQLGYKRFWIAEHHNISGITSSATPVLIGHVAQLTKKIRVGSGGIMLPNHAPLIVAETFGTLETLYPGRIDLGLGRAPGTDPLTARALRRDLKTTGQDFPELVDELQAYFDATDRGTQIRAIPGAGIDLPIWILGSSLFSADFAARKGLPYAFAAHFAPGDLMDALAIYRQRFTPSKSLKAPYTMACIPVVAAPSDREAHFLATTVQQKVLGLVTRNYRGAPAPPVESMETIWNPTEKAAVENFLGELIVGGPETVRQKISAFEKRTGVNEIMIHTDLYSFENTVRSYEIVSDLSKS